MKTKLKIPYYLTDTTNRLFILRNHLYLRNRLPEYFINSLLTRGYKERAENIFLFVIKKTKYILNSILLLTLLLDSLALPIELSPMRMGKKVKMVPRISSLYRQTKRSIYVLSTQARTRKFVSKAIRYKIYREIVSSIYFMQDSYRQTQN